MDSNENEWSPQQQKKCEIRSHTHGRYQMESVYMQCLAKCSGHIVRLFVMNRETHTQMHETDGNNCPPPPPSSRCECERKMKNRGCIRYTVEAIANISYQFWFWYGDFLCCEPPCCRHLWFSIVRISTHRKLTITYARTHMHTTKPGPFTLSRTRTHTNTHLFWFMAYLYRFYECLSNTGL